MDITTKTITTKEHTTTVSLDGLKGVAIAATKMQLGLIGEAASLVVAADATVNEDGSITVKVVEQAADAPAAPAADAAPEVVPEKVNEVTLVPDPVTLAAAAPLTIPGFSKAA